jgi:4-hydroxy-2-oxoheptanedioate aldolase
MKPLARNKFLAGLETGKPQFGLWLGIPDTSVAEMMAGAGFDWLCVDDEHGPFELRGVMAHLQAIAPYDVAPIVRPADGNPALLKKLCDIGAQTLLIPMVDTPEQAADAARAVRYPPVGRRGLGTSMARAARWNTVPGYLKDANKEICLIVQAETLTAMDNLEAIARTDGVDAVFFGPSDLSASMGLAGQAGHPDVVAAVADGIQTVRAAGKYAGLLCLDEKQVGHFVDAGANFVGVGVDTLLLGNSARSLAARYCGGDSENAGY